MSNGADEEKGGPRDLTKKILTLGLGAYFLTEDTVRRYVKDAKLPREVGRVITQNASKGKDELYGFVARELSEFLKQMDLQAELDRFVKRHKIRVNAEIEFVPTEGAEGEEEEGQVEWNVSLKPSESALKPEASEPEESEEEPEPSEDEESG